MQNNNRDVHYLRIMRENHVSEHSEYGLQHLVYEWCGEQKNRKTFINIRLEDNG